MIIEIRASGPACGDDITASAYMDGSGVFIRAARLNSAMVAYMHPSRGQARQIVDVLSAWLADGKAEQGNEQQEA